MSGSEVDNIPAIIGKRPTLKIHQVTEEELEILEKGTSGSLQLNFAIALLSFAVSTTIAIYTADNPKTVSSFIYGIMYSGYSMGLLCVVLWYINKSNQENVLGKIRARIEKDKRQERNQRLEEANSN